MHNFFFQNVYNIYTEINKLKETLIKYTIYKEVEEFKSLLNRLKNITEQLESLEVKIKKIVFQLEI